MARRSRQYTSADKVEKEWRTRFKGVADRAAKGTAAEGDVEWLMACLAAWMRDMKAWGENVRDDIIRLEAAVGAAPGDPGDPPPAPRDE